MLTFKRKLILTRAQAKRLDSWMGACRTVYNLCIEIRKEAWKNKHLTVHRFALERQMTEIRDIDWIADVPYDCLSISIQKMDLAFRKFFKGGGFPKFASKRKVNSITFRQSVNIHEGEVKIPRIGKLRLVKDAAVTGNVKTVTIKKEATGYFACITTDAVKAINNQDENQVLGIDVGIARLYTDSEGRHSENPRHFRVYERRLRVANRSLSRKKRFGKNWVKQAKRLRKVATKTANVRKDYLNKHSTAIAKAYNTVILEDLNVAGMVKSNLAKHIADAGWGEFRRMLAYKTNVIAINPAFTSQTCNSCGKRDKASRVSQSDFICTSCGAKSHADENAAKNILDQGMIVIRQRREVSQALDKKLKFSMSDKPKQS